MSKFNFVCRWIYLSLVLQTKATHVIKRKLNYQLIIIAIFLWVIHYGNAIRSILYPIYVTILR